MLRRFRMVLRDIWVASGEPGGVYRPDLHYMRGPGPKWHAKYGHLYPKSQPALRASHVRRSATSPSTTRNPSRGMPDRRATRCRSAPK